MEENSSSWNNHWKWKVEGFYFPQVPKYTHFDQIAHWVCYECQMGENNVNSTIFFRNKTIQDILTDQLQIFYDDYNPDTFFFFALNNPTKHITNQINYRNFLITTYIHSESEFH